MNFFFEFLTKFYLGSLPTDYVWLLPFSNIKGSKLGPQKKYLYDCKKFVCTVEPVHAVTLIKQSPVLKGHLFLVLS